MGVREGCGRGTGTGTVSCRRGHLIRAYESERERMRERVEGIHQ